MNTPDYDVVLCDFGDTLADQTWLLAELPQGLARIYVARFVQNAGCVVR